MTNVIKRHVDIAVIGAGPGGLGAAIRAKEEGAKDVVLVERAEELGGILPQCIHNGFGLHYFGEELSGPAYAHKLIKKVEKSGVEVLTHTMAIDLDSTGKITAANNKGIMEIIPRAVILCMGCRERSRGALMIPGERPAGIFTAGTAQRLINIEGSLPGKKVLILGSGDIGMIMARRLILEGAEVPAVIELLPFIGGLVRNEVQCLNDFNVPTYTKHTVTHIMGEERLERVEVAEVGADRKPLAGTEKVFDCDTLLLSVGLIPENELSLMAGVKLNPLTGGPLVDEFWQTSVPGIFVGGNVLHVHDLADYVTESSEQAASNAVRYISSNKKVADSKITIKAGKNIRYVVPNSISGSNPVSFYLRIAWPLNKPTISIGDIYQKKINYYLRPSEQIRLDVPADRFQNLNNSIRELVVSCEGEEVTF
ncbi:MAG: FAD-dependent oxidoreductase [Firmicutes bacterium]|nr:FAD-dependent oxidoreductase [Bacillota bacterium]